MMRLSKLEMFNGIPAQDEGRPKRYTSTLLLSLSVILFKGH